MNERKDIDMVSHPPHYEGRTSLECIEVMEVTFGCKAVCDFCLCNAFKYMWRYKNKNGEEDLRKAKWYLDYVSTKVETGYINPQDTEILLERLKDLHKHLTDRIPNYGA